jgi:hypothetical protein
MVDRSYTVAEIDALQLAHENKFGWGFYNGAPPSPPKAGYHVAWGRSYSPSDLSKAVESGVRLSMLAGHTAEDLLASELPEENECAFCGDKFDGLGLCSCDDNGQIDETPDQTDAINPEYFTLGHVWPQHFTLGHVLPQYAGHSVKVEDKNGTIWYGIFNDDGLARMTRRDLLPTKKGQ